MSDASNLLLTGASGVGKSTLLKRVGLALEDGRVRGFYSDALYAGGQRSGWRLDAFDGSDGGVLIHGDIQSEHRLGPYGVDLALLERLVVSQMSLDGRFDVYLVDEIGIVSPWLDRFTLAMDALLDAEVKVVAVIHAGRGGYVEQVRNRPDVAVREVTPHNRDSIFRDVLARVQAR